VWSWDWGTHPYLSTWMDYLMGEDSPRHNTFPANWRDHPTYIEDKGVYMCPSDDPHPSQVNEGRAGTWGFIFEYSYGCGVPLFQPDPHASNNYQSRGPHEASESEKQVVASEGHWVWQQNFSHQYVYGYSWDTPAWYSNTVSFRHKMGSTGNFVTAAGNVTSRKYIQMEDNTGNSSSTQDLFFYRKGENPLSQFY